jgi:hypothetical protein
MNAVGLTASPDPFGLLNHCDLGFVAKFSYIGTNDIIRNLSSVYHESQVSQNVQDRPDISL